MELTLHRGDKVGLVVCSDARPLSEKQQIDKLAETLRMLGLVPILCGPVYETDPALSDKERAARLNGLYADDSIKAVFDISGGDMANSLLEFLDYACILRNPKPFWGYSDLTALINSVYQKTGIFSCFYQVKNLIYDDGKNQIEYFKNSVMGGQNQLFDVHWRFVQGTNMKGVIIGGNIRCFLKLAGTAFMPDFRDKLLFLESCGGGEKRITSYLYQLRQLGAFSKIAGLLLGTFTRLDKEEGKGKAAELAAEIAGRRDLPIAVTSEVGHAPSSRCLVIGRHYEINRQ